MNFCELDLNALQDIEQEITNVLVSHNLNTQSIHGFWNTLALGIETLERS